MEKEFIKATKELVDSTEIRDKMEVEYTLEESRKMFSAEVNAFSNQKLRDAQVRISMEDNGMYRKMAYARSDARLAYYKWSSLKSLIERKKQ